MSRRNRKPGLGLKYLGNITHFKKKVIPTNQGSEWVEILARYMYFLSSNISISLLTPPPNGKTIYSCEVNAKLCS